VDRRWSGPDREPGQRTCDLDLREPPVVGSPRWIPPRCEIRSPGWGACCSTTPVMRPLADVEAIHTYEGTETIHMLLVDQDITGVGAFA
jgi:hypothetical protein